MFTTRIRTRPRSDIGVSPYEMMFGLPFLITPFSTEVYLEGEAATQKYLKSIGKTLEGLRKKGYLPQTSPLDTNAHNLSPGDWVLIKSWNATPLTPKFEGPFQVLLTSHAAVRTQERGWTHVTRVKGPVPPPDTGPDPTVSPAASHARMVTKRPGDLKLTLKKKPKVN